MHIFLKISQQVVDIFMSKTKSSHFYPLAFSFQAKIPCGSICKCVGCKNNESADNKSLMSLADAADMRHSQAVAARNQRLPYHDIQQPAVHNAQ